MTYLQNSILTTGDKLLKTLPHSWSQKISKWNIWESLIGGFDPKGIGLKQHHESLGVLRSPIGIAAGYDPFCSRLDLTTRIGASFIELGTVVPKVRNVGVEEYPLNLTAGNIIYPHKLQSNIPYVLERIRNSTISIPFGVNLGVSEGVKSSERAVKDLLYGVNIFSSSAKFFTVNYPQENVPTDFLFRFVEEASNIIPINKIWVKFNPEIEKMSFQKTVELLGSFGVGGLILCNSQKVTKGFRSGQALLLQSCLMQEWAWEVHKGHMSMIGSGGVMSGADVYAKIARGACAVQIMTALVDRGPGAVVQMQNELVTEMQLHGHNILSDAIGSFFKS